MMCIFKCVRLAALAAAAALMAAPAAADDSLAAARELYASAAYEEALTLLDRLREGAAGEEVPAVEQYRAFCLLALGRPSDAERAMEAVVAASPSYRPSGDDVSPRVRAAFAEVRRRLLPAILQQRYVSARTSFDQKDYVRAASGLEELLALIDDPANVTLAAQPPLSDLRTLAVGFRDLSLKAMTPPPMPPPDVAPGVIASALPAVPVAVPNLVYGPQDSEVVPPVTLRQSLPRMPVPRTALKPVQGSIEVLIDEKGSVEAAAMRVGVDAAYDPIALDAAKDWKYQPARLRGAPVRYRKIVLVDVKP
jgi:hypothetical protein